VAQRIALDPAAEITLETNPGTVEHAPFDGYRDAGVNRISFGVQSFDDDMLERLGRIHGADEARDAVKQAQDAGLSNINLDLMYALPEQSLAGALADVEHAIALAPAHVSHYQLTLEPNTRFAAQPPPLPDDDSAWAMQEACQALLASAGFVQYEISAYAREGRQCAHNLNYWRFGDYLGIGAGAHGKLTAPDGAVHRRWKQKHPRTFQLAAATRDRLGGDAAVAPDQLPFEFMLNVLRLNAGFALAHFERSTGLSRDAIAAPLAEARRRGWLAVADDAVVPTPLGARFLNDVIAEFLP
jgi:putative oxygen-independent coproporphyrinogen III oxidase